MNRDEVRNNNRPLWYTTWDIPKSSAGWKVNSHTLLTPFKIADTPFNQMQWQIGSMQLKNEVRMKKSIESFVHIKGDDGTSNTIWTINHAW